MSTHGAPTALARAWRSRASALVVLAVALAHVGITLLYLPPGERLSDSPVLRHDYALHYALSSQTLQALRDSGRAWAYDPGLMAGWPAGALLGISGHPFVAGMGLLGGLIGNGRAFNLTVLICLAAVPFLVALGARLLGVRPARIAFVAATVLVHVDRFTMSLAVAGLVAFFLGAALAVVAAGAAVSFAHAPTRARFALLALSLSAVLFAHPNAAVAAAAPVAVALMLGMRARGLRALFGFGGAAAVALLLNAIWLAPLAAFSSYKVSYRMYYASSARRALLDLLGVTDDAFRSLLVLVAVLGIAATAGRQRPGRLVAGAGLAWNALLGYLGSHLGPLAELEPSRFLVVLGLFAATAAPWGIARLVVPLARRPDAPSAWPLALVLVVVLLPALLVPGYRLGSLGLSPGTLRTRLLASDQAVIDWASGLEGWGRLLVDDPGKHGNWSSWTHLPPLIALRTGRELIAAPFATLPMEHARTLLAEGVLAGRPIAAWSDEELQRYLELYGVRWVLASTPATRERLARFHRAARLPLPGADGWEAFLTQGGGPFLEGAGSVTATTDRIDVRLDREGRAVLKYHCLETLVTVPRGPRLGCQVRPPDRVGFLTVEVGPGDPLAFRIENGGLAAWSPRRPGARPAGGGGR